MNVLDLAMDVDFQPQKVSDGKGGKFTGPSPFCGGKNHFRIWTDQNSGSGAYWCRQCAAYGNRIHFAQKLGFNSDCRVTGDDALAAEFEKDSDAPYSPRVPIEPGRTPFVPKARSSALSAPSQNIWMEKAWNLVSWATEKLTGSDGEQILAKKGIGMETARAFGLGWIPEDLFRTRKSWRLSTVIMENIGKSGQRLVLESKLDAILLDQVDGDITSITAMGTSRAKPDEPAARVLLDALCILVALDFDAAGESIYSSI